MRRRAEHRPALPAFLFLHHTAMNHPQAATIRRADYAPPAFWIDSVNLTFDLDPAKTRVLNRMTLRRNIYIVGFKNQFSTLMDWFFSFISGLGT